MTLLLKALKVCEIICQVLQTRSLHVAEALEYFRASDCGQVKGSLFLLYFKRNSPGLGPELQLGPGP